MAAEVKRDSAQMAASSVARAAHTLGWSPGVLKKRVGVAVTPRMFARVWARSLRTQRQAGGRLRKIDHPSLTRLAREFLAPAQRRDLQVLSDEEEAPEGPPATTN